MKSVYFLQAGPEGPIKIGCAADVLARARSVQCGCPYPVRVLATIPATDGLEVALHRRFLASRLCGEWFRPTPELLQHVATEAAPWVGGQIEKKPRPVEKKPRPSQAGMTVRFNLKGRAWPGLYDRVMEFSSERGMAVQEITKLAVREYVERHAKRKGSTK